ncbi:MAG: bacillithiol system redox-active protein YtxJ [Microscillaceae bacterium]|nr:bacillithiol system redox-active protein YtxJ [Microscillaceae bacterium]
MFKNLFGSGSEKKSTKSIPWETLQTAAQFGELISSSQKQPVLIFKHSTRCAVSVSVLARLEQSWEAEEMKGIKPYFLDLIRFREVSDLVAEKLKILHESPQVILVLNGEAFYEDSHYGILYEEIKAALANA